MVVQVITHVNVRGYTQPSPYQLGAVMHNNSPFPTLTALHHSITAMARLAPGRDGGPSIAIEPDSINRSILLVEDMIGALIPTRVEDNPILGRVMMRWVRPWGEFLLEVPAHRDRYVYHIYPYNGLSTEGEVSTIVAIHATLWNFLLGPHVDTTITC